MFQLRGLGDCTSDPSDPVCQAFYGAQSGAGAGGAAGIAGRVLKLPSNLINLMAVEPGPTDPMTQTTNPGTVISTTPSTKPWYLTWWGLGLIGAAGYGLWRYSHPKKTAAASPIAGLFGIRR